MCTSCLPHTRARAGACTHVQPSPVTPRHNFGGSILYYHRTGGLCWCPYLSSQVCGCLPRPRRHLRVPGSTDTRTHIRTLPRRGVGVGIGVPSVPSRGPVHPFLVGKRVYRGLWVQERRGRPETPRPHAPTPPLPPIQTPVREACPSLSTLGHSLTHDEVCPPSWCVVVPRRPSPAVSVASLRRHLPLVEVRK